MLIRQIIRMRRLNFLQYILQEEETWLVHTFFKAQLENPTPGDWDLTCLVDFKKLNINLALFDIDR